MPVGVARVEHFMRDLIDSGGALPLDGERIMDGNGEWIGERAGEQDGSAETAEDLSGQVG